MANEIKTRTYVGGESPFTRVITDEEVKDYNNFTEVPKEDIQEFLDVYADRIADMDELRDCLTKLSSSQFEFIKQNFRPVELMPYVWELIIKGIPFYRAVVTRAYPNIPFPKTGMRHGCMRLLSWLYFILLSMIYMPWMVFDNDFNFSWLGLVFSFICGYLTFIGLNYFQVIYTLDFKERLKACNGLRLYDLYEESLVIQLRLAERECIGIILSDNLSEEIKKDAKETINIVTEHLCRLRQKMENKDYPDTVDAGSDDDDE